MFKLKHKVAVWAFSVLTALGIIFALAPSAHAIDAQCYAPIFGGTTITSCDDASRAKCGSVACPSDTGKFEPDHCYQLQNTGLGPVYRDLHGCSSAPFTPINVTNPSGSASSGSGALGSYNSGTSANHSCGNIATTFNFNCSGSGNPVSQLLFAIIRFLSVGVGLVVIGSIVLAGIQYSASQGNPQATAAAQKRIASTVGALIVYVLIYAILNWLVPGGLFT